MPWPLLLFFFLTTGTLVYVLNTFSPTTPILLLAFFLLFLSIYSITAFLSRRAVQGVIVGSIVVAFFVFRLFHLTNILFTILLLILFVCIEGVVWKRK